MAQYGKNKAIALTQEASIMPIRPINEGQPEYSALVIGAEPSRVDGLYATEITAKSI